MSDANWEAISEGVDLLIQQIEDRAPYFYTDSSVMNAHDVLNIGYIKVSKLQDGSPKGNPAYSVFNMGSGYLQPLGRLGEKDPWHELVLTPEQYKCKLFQRFWYGIQIDLKDCISVSGNRVCVSFNSDQVTLQSAWVENPNE